MSQDLIDNFVAATAFAPSPELFRRWAAISSIAGILGRKVWVETSSGPIYPNLYTVLVGASASGKSTAITLTRKFWPEGDKQRLIPEHTSNTMLLNYLTKQAESMWVTDELFLSEMRPEFLSQLNHIYDNPLTLARHSCETSLQIQEPSLSILATTQIPPFQEIASGEKGLLPFLGRFMFMYSEPYRNSEPNANENLGIIPIANFVVKGPISFTSEAQAQVNFWHRNRAETLPRSFSARKPLHLLKLIIISVISRGETMLAEPRDVSRALSWLNEAESSLLKFYSS